MEGDESLTEALVREVLEELGLHIEIDMLVAEITYQGSVQYYFTARVVDGTFGTGLGQEIVGPLTREDGTYTPIWVSLSEMRQYSIYPKALVELILTAIDLGWPTTPVKLTDPGRTHR